MKPSKPTIDLQPLTDALAALKAQIAVALAEPLPPPKVGECWWIKAEIERYPHFICPAGQYCTITHVSEDVIYMRPATPVAWDEDDAETWGTVQFYLPSEGLEEFHATCEPAAEHLRRLAMDAAIPLTQAEEYALAEEALNVAVKAIQDRMGVDHGDAAGHFFAGDYQDRITEIFREYITYERKVKEAESK